MPQFIYRKSMIETPAYAKALTGTKAKSFILKYEEIVDALVANFAINI